MKPAIAVLLAALVLPAAAQNETSTCIDASKLQEKHEKRGGVVGGAQRVFSMPTITVDAPENANVCPLTSHQKFQVWWKRAYSPTNLLAAGLDAAIWQATDNDRRGWGQGWEAYGKRYGASLATAESTQFFQTALLPSLLKQDPRYFRKRTGGFGSRFFYSISRVLVTRTDSGHQTFNASAVGGALAATAISNLYLPRVNQDGGANAMQFGLSMANLAGWNFLSEFGPDVWHKIRGK